MITQEQINQTFKNINMYYKHYLIMSPTFKFLEVIQEDIDKLEKFRFILKENELNSIIKESKNIIEVKIGDSALQKTLVKFFDYNDIQFLAYEGKDRIEREISRKESRIKYLTDTNSDFRVNLSLFLKGRDNNLIERLGSEYVNQLIESIKEEFGLTKQKYLILDTETNSLYRKRQEGSGTPIQIAYLITDLERVYLRDSFYIKQSWIDPGAENIHKISMEILESKNPFNHLEAYYRIKDVLLDEDLIVVGHNISFDIKVIERLKDQALQFYNSKQVEDEDFKVIEDNFGDKMYCTLKESRKRKDINSKDNKLTTLLEYFNFTEDFISNLTDKIFGDSGIGAHDARYDVVSTMLLFKKLKE